MDKVAIKLNSNSPQANSTGKAKTTGPVTATADVRELDYLHHEVDEELKQTIQNKKQGFFGRIWTSIKNFFAGLFGIDTKSKSRLHIKKLYIDKPHPKNFYTPKVFIYNGLLDLEFLKENLDKYIFVLSGNLQASGGKYGQSSVLRPAKQMFPESVVELPVTKAHANVMDPTTLETVSFDEDTPQQIKENLRHIEAAIDDAICRSSATGKTILMLSGGYGTGGARMYAFAPETFKGMNRLFEEKLGVRNMLDPVSAKYSLEYVSETKTENTKSKDDDISNYTPEKISDDLWANGWVLSRHGVAA